jgi:hypothetical protein
MCRYWGLNGARLGPSFYQWRGSTNSTGDTSSLDKRSWHGIHRGTIMGNTIQGSPQNGRLWLRIIFSVIVRMARKVVMSSDEWYVMEEHPTEDWASLTFVAFVYHHVWLVRVGYRSTILLDTKNSGFLVFKPPTRPWAVRSITKCQKPGNPGSSSLPEMGKSNGKPPQRYVFIVIISKKQFAHFVFFCVGQKLKYFFLKKQRRNRCWMSSYLSMVHYCFFIPDSQRSNLRPTLAST